MSSSDSSLEVPRIAVFAVPMQFDFVKIELGYFLHKKEQTVTCVYRDRIQEKHGVWDILPESNTYNLPLCDVHSTQSRL